MNSIYQEKIMDHYRHPRNYGTLDNPDFSSGFINPSCGDTIEIQGMIKNNSVISLVFMGKGCVLSQASASLLTQSCLGKSIKEIQNMAPETAITLLGIQIGPVRSKCVTLAFMALQNGINNFLGQNKVV